MEPQVLDARLVVPFTCIVAGGTGSGKSVFCSKLIKYNKEMLTEAPDRIIYAYGEYQDLFEQMSNEKVEFVKGLTPEMLERQNLGKSTLLIIDDLADSIDGKFLSAIFTKYSHHRRISVVLLINNLYYRGLGGHLRDVAVNAHILVLFGGARNQGTIQTLAKQMYGPKWRQLVDAYTQAVSEPWGYILINSKSNTPEALRLRSKIFPEEENICWVSKNG